MIEWLNEWRDKTVVRYQVSLFISAMIEWLNDKTVVRYQVKGQNCSTLPSLFVHQRNDWMIEWKTVEPSGHKTVVRYQVFCSSAQWLNDWMNEGTKL